MDIVDSPFAQEEEEAGRRRGDVGHHPSRVSAVRAAVDRGPSSGAGGTTMEEGTLAIRLGHPRCPFCHETVGPRDVPAPCLACRAWHHAACLDEGRQRCAACGVHAASALATVRVRERTAARSPASRRERGWSVALWLGALAVAAGVNGSVLPAFARAFREVGLSLPAPTELVLGAGGWAWGLGVLSLLHAAALVEEARTRGQLRAAAFLVGVLGAVFGCWALLLPLLTIVQRL